MKRHQVSSTRLITILVVGIICGIFIHKYHMFPHKFINKISDTLTHKEKEKEKKRAYGPWSIGIYEGLTPFDLTAPEDIANPVLTGRDAVDIDAVFVADPFMLLKDGKYSMFFEVLNRDTNQGDIGLAESLDGKHWEYRKIIIDEAFHLSYPYVFEWGGDYYLTPESYQDLSVRLYKAVKFPDQWEYIGNLLTGYEFVDPSIFRHNNRWWLFVTTGSSDILNLHYADSLLGEWKPHPMNPIVKFDPNIARPGGRVISYNDRLYRLTQDDFPSYGIQVFAFEITELTKKTYIERIASLKPLVSKTGKGWHAVGMHHVDLHKIGDKWVAVVDGASW